jgi:hypothetical protein
MECENYFLPRMSGIGRMVSLGSVPKYVHVQYVHQLIYNSTVLQYVVVGCRGPESVVINDFFHKTADQLLTPLAAFTLVTNNFCCLPVLFINATASGLFTKVFNPLFSVHSIA